MLSEYRPTLKGVLEGLVVAVLVGSAGWAWSTFRPESWPTIAELLPYAALFVLAFALLKLARWQPGIASSPVSRLGSVVEHQRDEDTQRVRADLAEDRMRRALTEQEVLRTRFEQSEAGAKEHAEKATQVAQEAATHRAAALASEMRVIELKAEPEALGPVSG
jgi:hypothetical protein